MADMAAFFGQSWTDAIDAGSLASNIDNVGFSDWPQE
jgi:hypothetical protein